MQQACSFVVTDSSALSLCSGQDIRTDEFGFVKSQSIKSAKRSASA